MYKNHIKRWIDFTLALAALLLIGWFLVLVAILLYVANKGAGVFFTQERPGLGAKPFHVIKFKTMTDERDADGTLLPDAQRLTRIGRIVRSLSIDELPQIINVLRGDMALIGPRPLLMSYLPLYSKEQMRRHEVRPGITGWAQVNGRNLVKWNQRLAYDTKYVNNVSFVTDLKIILLTIKKVFAREDIAVNTDSVETYLDVERGSRNE